MSNPPSRGLHVALWIVQVLLAFAFGMAGAWKTFTPLAELATAMPWIAQVPEWTPRLAGGSELLGAIGLLVPSATRIAPKVTAAAAAGLVLVMLLAAAMHASHGDFGAIVPAVVLGALAAFVAWGRAVGAPIVGRN